MDKKLVLASLVVVTALGFLVFAAVQETAKAVVTVKQLLSESSPRENIRLGGRVATDDIRYRSTPDFLLEFVVHDIPHGEKTIPVEYKGVMPDTLRVGRDVILEGDFDGSRFHAKSLLTQCPSKYKPPVPGAEPIQDSPS